MATNELAAFVDRLTRSGLLDAVRLGQVSQQLLPGCADAEALARQLSALRWLTVPQARELLAGRVPPRRAATASSGWGWVVAVMLLMVVGAVGGMVLLIQHLREAPAEPEAQQAAADTHKKDAGTPDASDKLRRLGSGDQGTPPTTTKVDTRPTSTTKVDTRPTSTAKVDSTPPTTTKVETTPQTTEKPKVEPKPQPPPPPPTVPALGGLWLALTPDGKTLVSGDGGAVRLWDLAAGKVVRTLTAPNGYSFTSMALSPDGKTLATGTSQNNTVNPIALWDLASGQLLKAMNPVPNLLYWSQWQRISNLQASRSGTGLLLPTGPVLSIAFSPDGRVLATAGGSNNGNESDGMLRLYDVASGQNTAALGYTFPNGPNLPPHPGLNIESAVYTPDRKSIITGGVDGVLRWWDTATGTNKGGRATGTTGVPLQVAVSPDGKTLASWTLAGQEVQLWDVAQATKLRSLATNDAVYAVAFSPDSKTLACGGGSPDPKQNSGELKLWDGASGENLATMKGHIDGVNAVVFSPDGKALFSQSYQDITQWDVAGGKSTRTFGR